MNLHDKTFTDEGTMIMRVSGGWIYIVSGNSVFVPYSEEFKEHRIKMEIEQLIGSENGRENQKT